MGSEGGESQAGEGEPKQRSVARGHRSGRQRLSLIRTRGGCWMPPRTVLLLTNSHTHTHTVFLQLLNSSNEIKSGLEPSCVFKVSWHFSAWIHFAGLMGSLAEGRLISLLLNSPRPTLGGFPFSTPMGARGARPQSSAPTLPPPPPPAFRCAPGASPPFTCNELGGLEMF